MKHLLSGLLRHLAPSASLALALVSVHGAIVLEHHFALDSTGADTIDGSKAGTGTFNSAMLRDESGNNYRGQTIADRGSLASYVSSSMAIIPFPLPPGWDGHALAFSGEKDRNYVRYGSGLDRLTFNGSFSAFARVLYSAGDGGTIMGSAGANNNGWSVLVSNPGVLEVDLRGGLLNVLSGKEPNIANNLWTDIGLIFEGATGDDANDTLKVFLNGKLIRTATGAAKFGPAPFGFNFSIGGDTFGNTPAAIHFERVILWDEAISEVDMAALSTSNTSAGLVLEHNFLVDAGGAATVNNRVVATNFNPANLKDDSGNGYAAQAVANSGEPPAYAIGSIPVTPLTLPPGWDGRALRFGGQNYVRYDSANHPKLSFSGSFSSYARILHAAGDGGTVLGSGGSNNKGWNIRISDAGQLQVDLGGGLSDVFGASGPFVGNNSWTDIGLIFNGKTGDANDDSLKIFVNGKLSRTATGKAAFEAAPAGFNFSIGSDTFGNSPLPVFVERILLWNRSVEDDLIASLSSRTRAEVGFLPAETINLASVDVPRDLTVRVILPGPANGTVTITSSNPTVAGNGQAAFLRTGPAFVDVAISVLAVGSAELSLSNNLGLANGPARPVHVLPLDSLTLRAPVDLVLGSRNQSAILGAFGAAGTRDLTVHPQTTLVSDDAMIISVLPGAVLKAARLGTATVTAFHGSKSAPVKMTVVSAVGHTFSLDWDGADEPFYTEPEKGNRMPLPALNSVWAGAGIPLEVGASSDNWAVVDCCAGNHFLLGPVSAAHAEMFGNFTTGIGASRIRVAAGFYPDGVTGTLTAYAERITDPSNLALAKLKALDSETITIPAGVNFLTFELSNLQGAKSFALEMEHPSTGPAINTIEFDAIEAKDPVPLRVVSFVWSGGANVQMVFTTPAPARTHKIEAANAIASPTWNPISLATFHPPIGDSITADFPVPTQSPRFFRVTLEP